MGDEFRLVAGFRLLCMEETSLIVFSYRAA
jgi:hypothetical protein